MMRLGGVPVLVSEHISPAGPLAGTDVSRGVGPLPPPGEDDPQAASRRATRESRTRMPRDSSRQARRQDCVSAPAATRRKLSKRRAWMGSNHRPPRSLLWGLYQLSVQAQGLARLDGYEPSTSGLRRCSRSELQPQIGSRRLCSFRFAKERKRREPALELAPMRRAKADCHQFIRIRCVALDDRPVRHVFCLVQTIAERVYLGLAGPEHDDVRS